MSVRSYITIRVIPASIGAFPAIDNSCRLVEFAEMKPVVYVEEQTVGNFLEDAATVAAYRKIFDALANYALDAGQSQDRAP